MALNFPNTILLDDFNRANETLNDNRWITGPTIAIDGGGLRLVSNAVTGFDDFYSGSYWATEFAAEVEASADITSHGLSGDILQFWGRLKDPLDTNLTRGYIVEFGKAGGTDTLVFYRLDPINTYTQLGATANQEYVIGDKVGMRMSGSTISAWISVAGATWTTITTRDDTTYYHTGFIASILRRNFQGIDNYRGGSLQAKVIDYSRRPAVFKPGLAK